MNRVSVTTIDWGTSSFTVPIKLKKTFTFTIVMNQYIYNISWNGNDDDNERID